MSEKELQEAVKNPNEKFLQPLQVWASNITGSNGYWYCRRQELEAVFKYKKPGTVFFTFSFADNWCMICTGYFQNNNLQKPPMPSKMVTCLTGISPKN
jgi:hypothetical protein